MIFTDCGGSVHSGVGGSASESSEAPEQDESFSPGVASRAAEAAAVGMATSNDSSSSKLPGARLKNGVETAGEGKQGVVPMEETEELLKLIFGVEFSAVRCLKKECGGERSAGECCLKKKFFLKKKI